MEIVVTGYSPFCKGVEYKNIYGSDVDVFSEPLIKELAAKYKKS